MICPWRACVGACRARGEGRRARPATSGRVAAPDTCSICVSWFRCSSAKIGTAGSERQARESVTFWLRRQRRWRKQRRGVAGVQSRESTVSSRGLRIKTAAPPLLANRQGRTTRGPSVSRISLVASANLPGARVRVEMGSSFS